MDKQIIEHIEPAQKAMNNQPEDAVVGAPAQDHSNQRAQPDLDGHGAT